MRLVSYPNYSADTQLNFVANGSCVLDLWDQFDGYVVISQVCYCYIIIIIIKLMIIIINFIEEQRYLFFFFAVHRVR